MTSRVRLPVIPLALAGALMLSGCGASRPSGHADPSAAAALSLRGLSSLTNYRARLTSGVGQYRMTIRTQVHSPDDWAAQSGVTVRHIGAVSYVHFGNRWFAHPQQPDTYAQDNLPSFARQFYTMAKVSGAVVRRGKPCRQAGLPGHTWMITGSGGSTFGEKLTACIADGSGALLKLVIAARGAAMSGRDTGEIYEITAIDNVPPLHVPANVTGS